MHWFSILLISIGINWIIGIVVMAGLDKDESILGWFKEADQFGLLGPFLQFLFIQCWLAVLIIYLQEKNR